MGQQRKLACIIFYSRYTNISLIALPSMPYSIVKRTAIDIVLCCIFISIPIASISKTVVFIKASVYLHLFSRQFLWNRLKERIKLHYFEAIMHASEQQLLCLCWMPFNPPNSTSNWCGRKRSCRLSRIKKSELTVIATQIRRKGGN